MSASNGVSIGLDVTAKISDASIAKFKIVIGDTTDTTNADMVMTVGTAETDKPLGITQEATTAADADCLVRMGGISKCVVDGNANAIDIGTSICAGAAGVGHASTTPDAAQQWAVGYALEPSAADGDIIKVLVSPHLIVKGTA